MGWFSLYYENSIFLSFIPAPQINTADRYFFLKTKTQNLVEKKIICYDRFQG